MLPIELVRASLQSIPSKVRNTLYLLVGVVGLLLGSLEVAGVESVYDVPVGKAIVVLIFVSSALGFTASANVTHDDFA